MGVIESFPHNKHSEYESDVMTPTAINFSRIGDILQEATLLASSATTLSQAENARVALLELSRQLVGILEQPEERVSLIAHGVRSHNILLFQNGY